MTEAERDRERVMAWGVGTDVLLATPMLIVGLWSGSLTLLADALRACFLTLLEIFTYIVMRRIHRGSLRSYQYGCGKIECALNALIGAALAASSALVIAIGAYKIAAPDIANPLGLAAAAAIAGANTAQNAWLFVAFLRSRRAGRSVIIDGQVRTRLVKLVSSIVAAAAIAVSAVHAGDETGRLADLAGSAIVVAVMLWTAWRLIAEALPDLTDRMLDPGELALVHLAILARFDSIGNVERVRTRRAGAARHIEITIAYRADWTIGQAARLNEVLKNDVEALIPLSQVLVVLTPAVHRPAPPAPRLRRVAPASV